MRDREHDEREARGVNRRDFLRYTAIGGTLAAAGPLACGTPEPAAPPAAAVSATPAAFELEEATVARLQDAMRAGRLTAREITESYLARIEAVDRQGPDLRPVIETNPEALDHRRRARPGAQGRARARAAARRPGPDQGQHRHRRPDDDHRRLAGAGRRDRGAGRRVAARAARGGRGDPREGEPERVGELPLDPLVERLERARRAVPQPLRARPQPVRLELGLGRRGRRQPVRGRGRHRDRRLDRLPLRRRTASSASSRRWGW